MGTDIDRLLAELARLRDDLTETITDRIAPTAAAVAVSEKRLDHIESQIGGLLAEVVQIRHDVKVADEVRQKVEQHDTELRRMKQATALAGAAASGVISAGWEWLKSRF